ncbi:hypothetical protein GCM10017779_53380 [Streptomyces capillispiralis]|uniref:Uncharacterized protein n=2 Tax=Streptomyces capillispiralis TaxID=68182 RepID=A0A561TLT6_9ACTN|nr:hypothetical protein FHX78_115042 [Streptomyces capillispiralis]GHH94881.1 hypothetical protein GCM10017779_53380 [Streptomyces capillispiralis]
MFAAMEIKEAVLWALLGGGAAEMTLFLGAVKPSSPKKQWVWPWTPSEMRVYGVWMAVRVTVSGALAAPFAATGKVSDALTAFLVGVVAPLLMAKLAATAQQFVGRTMLDPPQQDQIYPSDGPAANGQGGTIMGQSTSQVEHPVVPEARTAGDADLGNVGTTGVGNAEQ